ncbi:FAD-dependent monooxygenase [Streptomyces sp. NPDC047813]|uniref:NAD(P)/FAD-dependent oxidoreductase n=1 Tax=Streptomyces sp. NPDC047813 TaxID=3154608 RepID=UPI0033E09D3E
MVIGAGISGLLVARVLSDHFSHVILVEKDLLPATPEPRPGIPQGNHVHALFTRGLSALEELLPGFGAELSRAGGHRIELGRDLVVASRYGWGVRRPGALPAAGASRPLIEHIIRARVRHLPQVDILDGHRVTGLTGDPERIETVEAQDRTTGTARTLAADLVVDAAGRGSAISGWLSALGCPPPPSRTVDARVGYATRIFRARPGSDPVGWRACYSLPLGPSTPQGGVLAPIEDNRWIVTLTGAGESRPSASDDDFLPFTHTLLTPLIHDFVAAAEALTPVRSSNATANRRRHPERAERLPGNLLITGDSACALNPVYAQGMTVAALGALALRDCLADPAGLPGTLGARFHRAQRAVQDLPWLLATTADSRYRGTTGLRPAPHRALLAYGLPRLVRAGTRDPDAQQRFLALMAMTAHPADLIRPRALLTLSPGRPEPAPPRHHRHPR